MRGGHLVDEKRGLSKERDSKENQPNMFFFAIKIKMFVFFIEMFVFKIEVIVFKIRKSGLVLKIWFQIT